jgi:hypothetical protein
VAQDDWRVTVTLHPDQTGWLRRRLHEAEIEGKARERLGGRVIVGGGEEENVVYLYAATSDAAHEAQRIVADLLEDESVDAHFAVDCWHPAEERWEPENVPLPATPTELEAEHERMEEDEIRESEELGGALWEVRIELASHGDATELADRLEGERGISVIRRWKYVILGADTEEQGHEIAGEVKDLLPPGATIHVEPSGTLVWQLMPANPFAVLGGLGT